MKMICIVFWAVLTVCFGAPQYSHVHDSRSATILNHKSNNVGIGNYDFSYQTSNGITREERAEFKNAGTSGEGYVVQGSYSYVGDDGITYTVNYVADENGFRALGSHIPKI